MADSGVAAPVGLQAFETYAVGLQALLGSTDVVAQALALLLRCFDGWPALGGAAAASDTALWCLEGRGLLGEGPEAAARALLLRAAAAGGGAEAGSAAGEALLAAAAPALARAPEPVAEHLAETLALVLPAGAAAGWLRALRARAGEPGELDGAEAARAYAHAARALLARGHGEGVGAEAWAFAEAAVGGADASQRRLCLQRLIPPLVAATPCEEASRRLSGFVEVLLRGAGRAEVADALHLAVEFSGLLLEHWRLFALRGEHDELGVRLIATGLRHGLKECHGLRKEAKLLLQRAVHAALSRSPEEELSLVTGASSADLGFVWRSYWELFDSIEDYSSHLLKSSWDLILERLLSFLKRLPQARAGAGAADGFPCWAPAVFSPYWLEVFFSRAFGHDNDTVQKFVLGELLKLDQEAAQLSEPFVLQEVLARFSHSIDSLYPRSDVTQAFERRVAAFFCGFLRRGEGAGAARRLLEAALGLRAVHHTPLRLVLSALTAAEAPGALGPAEALDVVERFFGGVLARMPVSVRLPLALALVGVATRLCRRASAEEAPGLAGCAAKALASVPDNLLARLQEPLAALLEALLGPAAQAQCLDLLGGLLSSRAADCQALASPGADGQPPPPMGAAMLTLGALRCIWAGAGREGAPTPCGTLVWPVLEPALRDIHRRPYVPRHAAVAALLGCAYSVALLPDGPQALEGHPEARREVLAYVEGRAAAAVAEGAGVREEAPWVWLYALVLERLWGEGLPHGEAIAEGACGALRRGAAAAGRERPAEAVLAYAAATSLLGALAPRVGPAGRRAELFALLWEARLPKPQQVTDARFQVGAAEGQGSWVRNRLEEYEDLHRAEREGLGRVVEWRDATAVFLLAKWRALAKLSLDPDVVAGLEGGPCPPGQGLAAAILAELETLQPPHVAFWAVVARRVAYPAVFGAGAPAEEQRDALRALCRGLRGAVLEGTGDGSTYMPRGCMAELAAALCDPQLCEAERRLFPGEGAGPLTEGVRGLLAQGEVAMGISRAVAAPLLASLLRPWPRSGGPCGGAPPEFAGLLVALLFHSEAAISDGALSHSPGIAAGTLDAEGPGGERALAAVCPAQGALAGKFGGTQGLPRILALAALDGLAARGGGSVPPLVAAVLQGLLSVLRETLEQLTRPAAGKAVANRPPTPMPASARHRTQLRGWQAVLVLGCHADRETAAALLPELFFHLQVPHVPDVRDYQELLGCTLCSRFEDLAVQPLLVPALRNFDSGVQVSASLLVISAYLFRRWSGLAAGAGLAEERPRIASLVRAVAPYLSHNAAYVRGIAAWGFHEILHSLGPEGLAAAGVDEPLLGELYRFLVESKECQKMRGRLRPVFADFEPDPRTALACLTERCTVLPDPQGGASPSAPEGGPAGGALHSFSDGELHPPATFLDLLKDEVAEEMAGLWDRSDPTQYPSSSESWQEMLRQAAVQAPSAGAPGAAAHSEALGGAAGGAAGLQRKFSPPTAPEAPREPGAGWVRPVRAPLLVVASLVDKAPNLAGLCRTSEVFGCQALCMANAKVTKDQAFQSISVTAEKWLPIREVPRSALRDHLLALRAEGYALVGVEQTHDSVPLDEWSFSRSTALVLGAEKEGIDAELLPLLDACVEIPQSGQLRSLNVHVSGSLAIWEYMRQRRRAPA